MPSSPSPRRHAIASPGCAAVLGLLPEFLEPSEGWALMGGTALAEYFLGHRQSDDVDLFTLQEGAVAALAGRLTAGLSARIHGRRVETQVVSPTLRRVWVEVDGGERVKVELIQDSSPRFEEPVVVDGMPVASLVDITVGKLGAFVTRDEARDLVDLWGIERLAGTPLPGYYPFLFEKDPGLAAYPQAIAEAWQRHGRRAFVAPLVMHIQPDVDLRVFCEDEQRALMRFLRDRALET
jgi:hypothetical protein